MQVSIVSYQQTKLLPDFRIDAECYKPFHLKAEKVITNKTYYAIRQLSKSVINFGAYSLCNYIEFFDDGIPFLVTEDIYNNIVSTNKLHFISPNVHTLLYKSHCKRGQILLTMAGAYLGQAAVFDEDFECSSNQAIAKITLKKGIDPYFISTYLNCKYGQSQIERLKTGTGQPNINLGLIQEIKVPELCSNFQKKIRECVTTAKNIIKESEEIYSQAEQLLLEELGLTDWQEKHKLTFVKNYSDTKQAERIDAEYFQPKYDAIIKAIKNYSGGWDILDNLVKITKSIEPGSSEYKEEGIKFLRVSNLSKFGLDNSSPVYLSEKFYKENKQHQPKQGNILLSKDATPGIAYYLNEKPEEMIVSGGILRLKLKDECINEDYLALALNSVIVQEQAKRDAGGSVIKHWRPDQIKNVAIPILKDAVQEKIQEKVRIFFEARAKSKQLLEVAKQAVEMAIEENEQTAMRWIEKQGNFEE